MPLHSTLSIFEDSTEYMSGGTKRINKNNIYCRKYYELLMGIHLQSLIIGDTPAEDVTSASSAALMSKIPPQYFCSTVLRLIALHVISLGEGYSLENVCNGQAMFSNQTKTENMLLNLLIPLFLRVGTGRKGKTIMHMGMCSRFLIGTNYKEYSWKPFERLFERFCLDVPKLRQTDISFALTAVLNTLWPPTTKTIPLTVQTLKTTTDARPGSLTFAARDSKTLTKTSLTLYQVAFLGELTIPRDTITVSIENFYKFISIRIVRISDVRS